MDLTAAGRVAVVTGAAHGLGFALSRELAHRAWRVALIDTDVDALREAGSALSARYGTRVSTYVADVTAERELKDVAAEVRRRDDGIDLVVNNAAISASADFTGMSAESFDRIIAVNFQGVTNGCRVFVPHLRARSTGQILNVSNCFGWVGYPGKSAYAASKAAIRAFSECLRIELAPLGVGVTVLYPGPVRTGIVERGISDSTERKAKEAAYLGRHGLSPEFVARRCLDRLRSNPARIVIGAQYRLIDLAARAVPNLMGQVISRASRRVGF